MVCMNSKFVMFGGILEITKESDEVYIFDPAISQWNILELNSNIGDLLRTGTNTFKDDLDSDRCS